MLIPLRNCLTRKSPYSILIQYSRQNYIKPQLKQIPTAIYVVPKRQFGNGKKIQIFGHAKPIRASKYPDYGWVIALIFGTSIGFMLIDWEKIRIKYGYNPFPLLRDVIFNSFYARSGYEWKGIKDELRKLDDPISAITGIRENKEHENLHAYMKQQALIRYNQEVQALAEEDPELKELLKGTDPKLIPRENEEIFQAKIKWVASFKEAQKEVEEETVILEKSKNNYNFDVIKRKIFADTIEFDSIQSEDFEDSETEDKSMGFRNRKICEYENRLRQYSTPDKIFRYFATYKVLDEKENITIMMTPDDFLRSITPGIKQPENLGLDKYVALSNENVSNLVSNLGMEEESIFQKLSSGGLISFSDYIFLLTVLSTSRRHFEIAFKMFDLNGDGDVDAKEFEVVTNLMKSQSSMGARHRDHQNTGNTFKGINSGLITYFFGENKEGILTVEKFLEFQRQLQNEILRLEFSRKTSGHSNKISEKEFADLLIAYAGFPAKKKQKMLKRVKKNFHDDQGITLEDFLNFYQVLYSINDIDTALTFYNIAGAPIERSTMKHVAQTVSGVELSDHVIDVVFVLFDENGDGKLSNKEFISVMKQRVMRGLEKPKDTGIGKIFSAMAKCASDAVSTKPLQKN